MKKTLSVIIILLLASIIMYFLKLEMPTNETVESSTAEKFYTINFEFDNEDISSVKYPYTFDEEQNLFIITQNIAQEKNWNFDFEDYGEMGILVKTIKDKENGEDQKYWQYYVEGAQPQISADRYLPKENEIINWKFDKSEF